VAWFLAPWAARERAWWTTRERRGRLRDGEWGSVGEQHRRRRGHVVTSEGVTHATMRTWHEDGREGETLVFVGNSWSFFWEKYLRDRGSIIFWE
jgi:hypothetical protein